MKILVIGGNRFFGRRLVMALAHAGHDLTVYNRGNFPLGLKLPNLIEVRGDRNNYELLKKTVQSAKWDAIYDQVAYEAKQARAMAEICKGHTQKFIFTSSQAAYSVARHDLVESAFDPFNYKFTQDAIAKTHYGEAKRQCEAVFHQAMPEQTVSLRFPIVAGPDDYTERIYWHVKAVLEHRPVYYPKPDARISFIHAKDAAAALALFADSPFVGPVNASASDNKTIRELIGRIASKVQTEALFAAAPEGVDLSVLNWRFSITMNSAKLISLGFCPAPLSEWLDGLIVEYLERLRGKTAPDADLSVSH